MIAELNYTWTDAMALVSFERRHELEKWQKILERYETAPDKGAVTLEIRQTFNVPQTTLYRNLQAFRKLGVAAFLPVGVRRRLGAKLLNIPAGFIPFWQCLCEENQRKIAPAYRSLFFDHLLPGKIIPGYGEKGEGADWRGIYAQEHPEWPIPQECPYRPYDATPDGWSESTLRRYAPDKYCLTAARIGRAAASVYLPKIPTTRVGLRFAEVFVVDDVYHDNRVTFAGNREPQICVELGALELLSGHYCSYGIKPVREKGDGTREVLREAYMRYLLADIVCRIGVCSEGAIIAGEWGTAHVRDEIIVTLNRWFGRPDFIRFEAGGLRHEPIAKGLFEARPGGNFRFKAALESHHNLKKNELAQLPGQKGMDPEHAPEDLPTKTSYHVALVKACAALAEQRPDLIQDIRSPFPHYYKYVEAVALLYNRIADRKEHSLEGFEECGLTTEEFRLSSAMPWTALPALLAEASDSDRQAIYALIQADPKRYLRRVMSPREAFAHCSRVQQVIRLPEAAIPEILGRDLGDVVKVEEDMSFCIPDRYLPGRSYTVVAQVETPRGLDILDRGSSWLVHLSPYDGRYAYISRPDGEYVGKAPVLVAGAKSDVESIRKNLGLLRQVETAELKRLAPLGEKRLREAAEMASENLRLLGVGEETTPAERRGTDEERRLAALADEGLSRNYKGDTDYGN